MLTGTIFDIKKFSIHDGPGIRTTIFFKGCPLNCWWCHNPESQARQPELLYRASRCIHCAACVAACPQGAISWRGDTPVTAAQKCVLCRRCLAVCYAEAREIAGREMRVAAVVAESERDRAFYDESGGGVTLSGGEPLLQGDFLRALLRALRTRDIHTALDTCGYAAWETLDVVRGYVDLFLYDLKLMDAAAHRRFTGVSNELILRNLQELARRGHNIIVRAPIIPGITDGADNLRDMGRFVAALPHAPRIELLPYHHIAVEKYTRLGRDYALGAVRPPSEEQMQRGVQILREAGAQIVSS